MPLKQAQEELFANPYAESIPYRRGFVYLLLVDGLLRQGTDGLINLDNIVLDLMHRQRNRERVQSRHWLEALYPFLGEERAAKEFSRMMAGETLDLQHLSRPLSAEITACGTGSHGNWH